ncbi:DUF5009 domain-containing protein [Dysgonomonas sp. 521]|uniref:DUF5009 domain-containing protein n=1 Tax=Dysgonomonas sp. 521 TaxID=2302932 RepID=UPI002104017D|nr:DUF5009 domain-containing protein [Dysgonomonas sp. 521]
MTKPGRIASIDVYRALTMLFMIFVNDLFTISDVPHWLEHAAADEDMLGFSDIVFPSFLFILGMSIPLAIEIRRKKGDSKIEILKHILIRSVALLVMGMFTVNLEAGVSSAIGKPAFTFIMLLAFFFIWNLYPKTEDKKKQSFYSILKIVGIIILAVLAFIYRDAGGDIFQPRWWGILGLIGWTYLLCAIIYLFLNKKRIYLIVAFFFFTLLCIAGSNRWLGSFDSIIPGNGCFHAFTMCGMLISLLFNQPKSELSINKKMLVSTGVGIGFLLAGFISHYFWIISKIQATPTWLFLCTGISVLFYVFMYWFADMQKKASWFDIIKPAGTATLTCYLVPYFLYSLFVLIPFSLPEVITTSPVGLIKCVVFSFITIGITALLGKAGVKLKI